MQNTDMNQIIKSVSIMRSQNCDQVFYQKNKWSSSIIYSTHNQDEHLHLFCFCFVFHQLVYRSFNVGETSLQICYCISTLYLPHTCTLGGGSTTKVKTPGVTYYSFLFVRDDRRKLAQKHRADRRLDVQNKRRGITS